MVPEIDPPIEYGWVYGVTTRGSSGFVAVGKGGWIYLGDSKGADWKRSTNFKDGPKKKG